MQNNYELKILIWHKKKSPHLIKSFIYCNFWQRPVIEVKIFIRHSLFIFANILQITFPFSFIQKKKTPNILQ